MKIKLKKDLYHRHFTNEPISFHATFDNLTPEEIEMHGLKKSIHGPRGQFIVRLVYNFENDVERASKLSGN